MRIVTRGDLDGLTSSFFISIMEMSISDLVFAHPKDMQEGNFEITEDDVIVNLPYHPNAMLWFDHHSSPGQKPDIENLRGRYDIAPSCARVVYDYYGGPEELEPYKILLQETDRVDSAQLTEEDVLNPKRWVLLSYTLDPRSGFGAFKDYFLQLMGWVRAYDVDKILGFSEVKVRCDKLLADQDEFKDVMLKYSKLDGNVVITDLRNAGDVPTGNRFLIYTLFPESNISMRVFHGRDKETVVIALGHSIFNRTSKTDVGMLMGQYGGGGHKGAGTCQVPAQKADMFVEVIASQIKEG